MAQRVAPDRAEPARRDELVKVAARLFRDRGYDATSMQGIADEMGILKGSLYHYVSTKEDLLWLIVEPPLRALVDEAERIFADESVPITQRIRAAIVAHCASFQQHYPHMFVMTLEHGASLTPARRKDFDALRNRYYKLWKDAIAGGVGSGDLRADLDPSITAHAALGMINWMPRWFAPRRRLNASDIGSQFASVVISGIEP